MIEVPPSYPVSKSERLALEVAEFHHEAAQHIRAMCAVNASTTRRLVQARAQFDALAAAVTEMMKHTNPQTIAATLAALDAPDTRRKRKKKP